MADRPADLSSTSLQDLAGSGAANRGEWLAVIRADQRRRWLRGRPLPLEAYLANLPALADDPAALLDLVHNEMALREELGERPRRDEYLRRFPALAGALER